MTPQTNSQTAPPALWRIVPRDDMAAGALAYVAGRCVFVRVDMDPPARQALRDSLAAALGDSAVQALTGALGPRLAAVPVSA